MRSKENQQQKKLLKQKIKNEKEKQKIQKEQQKDFERYGIKAGEIDYARQKGVKKSYAPLFECLRYIKECRWQMVLVVVCLISIAALDGALPILIQQVTDNVYAGVFDMALILLAVYAAVEIIAFSLAWGWDLLSTRVVLKTSQKMQKRVIEDLTKTQVKKFDAVNSGAIISRVNNDTSSFMDSLLAALDHVFFILKGLVWTFIFMFVNVWLGIAVLSVSVIFYIVDLADQNFRYRYRKKVKHLEDKNYGVTNEIVRGVRDVKTLNLAETIKAKHKNTLANIVLARWNMVKVRGKFVFAKDLVWSLGNLACCGLAVVLLLQGVITVGGLVMCIMYCGRTFQQLTSISNIKVELRSSLVSAERITEIMKDDYPKEVFGERTLENVRGKIQFKDVKFAYSDEKPLFENLNLEIQPNECVGFVGKSGEGKSTIVSLISKLYDIQGGQILIDDVPINEFSEQSLRSNICVVSQSPYIFNMTIKENLLLARPNATLDELKAVCKSAYLDEFIDDLPKQYDTEVGEGGVQLSGGQKQRLAIARALLAESKIILFDEATSALDNESQEKIKKTISNIKATKTILIVAHRLTTVQDCDKIFVIANNNIVNCGTHRQLMKSCPEYIALYQNEDQKK